MPGQRHRPRHEGIRVAAQAGADPPQAPARVRHVARPDCRPPGRPATIAICSMPSTPDELNRIIAPQPLHVSGQVAHRLPGLDACTTSTSSVRRSRSAIGAELVASLRKQARRRADRPRGSSRSSTARARTLFASRGSSSPRTATPTAPAERGLAHAHDRLLEEALQHRRDRPGMKVGHAARGRRRADLRRHGTDTAPGPSPGRPGPWRAGGASAHAPLFIGILLLFATPAEARYMSPPPASPGAAISRCRKIA